LLFAVASHHYVSELIQASLTVNVKHLGIAVRKVRRPEGFPTVGCDSVASYRDFETVVKFSETLQASRRFELPLEGALVIGY